MSLNKSLIGIGTVLVLSSGIASAQTVVINGLYDCQRATNGRAYCKKQGAPANSQYIPVTDDVFNAYEAARLGRPASVPAQAPVQVPQVNQSQVNQSQVINNGVIIQLKSEASDIKGQIELMRQVLVEQRQILTAGQGDSDVNKLVIEAITERLADLQSLYSQKSKALSGYITPTKPDDADLGITARKASEIYPKIPYYIPGTRETGEFWVEPIVSDDGVLKFRFKFVDVNSNSAEKVRLFIEMSSDELERTQKALLKVAANSKLAHEKKIRRKLDVRIECFPQADCPAEGQKLDQKASTEIIFSVNEDGSTSGRIQRNKGRFEEGYNVSIKSGLLLQAYLKHVNSEGKAEFEAGTASTDELKSMFR